MLTISDAITSECVAIPCFPAVSTEYVSNVNTTMKALVFENTVWPLTVNKTEYTNALICSPYTTYVSYPLGELKKFKKKWIRCAIIVNAIVMSVLFRITKINQVVQVNNNLNSLIKHPKQFGALLPAITKKITMEFPAHAVIFFRVNDQLDKSFLMALQKNGYMVFPDRVAHVFFPENHFMQRNHVKRDMSLLRKSTYQIVSHDQLTDADAERLSELYRQLFIEKHSTHNPIYTTQYFRESLRHHWHHYTALRHSDGRIDAFISWFESENTLICGPLGYDSQIDSKIGLYRQLVALCLQHAASHQLPFNMGGGSDEFKTNRGSTPTVEYTAVYCQHLPFYRKIPWKILRYIFNKLLLKIVRDSAL